MAIVFHLLLKWGVWWGGPRQRIVSFCVRALMTSGMSIKANIRIRLLYYSLRSHWGQLANDKMAQDAIMWRYLSRRFAIPQAVVELPCTSRELIFWEMCFHKETNLVDVLYFSRYIRQWEFAFLLSLLFVRFFDGLYDHRFRELPQTNLQRKRFGIFI